MKRIILAFIALSLLAAGCVKITLQKNVPESPKESYEALPR